MLGLDYIWIDSICIVQDDKEEWASEVARMGDIHSSAYVVLAATAANSAAEGFLRLRDRSQKIRSLIDPENLFTVNARVVDTHDYDQGPVQLVKQPLSKRGWALQERALAHRTVHFLRDEILFECRSSVSCECGRFSDQPYGSMAWETGVKALPPWDSLIASIWLPLVVDFSECSLTHADDALPALSGIAQRTLSLNPGRYFAGMWERDVAHQLCWVVHLPSLATDGKRKPRPRPTFSWVNSSGPVSSKFAYLEQTICALVAGRSVPLAGDVYGQVKEASIQMHGQTIPARSMIDRIEHMSDSEYQHTRSHL
jgi:hypothetical protein